MNPYLFQARSLSNMQLDMVHCHQAELRREIEAIRSARAAAANRIRNPRRSLARVVAAASNWWTRPRWYSHAPGCLCPAARRKEVDRQALTRASLPW